MRDNSDELFPVVDDEGRVLGSMTRGEAHGGCRVLHPVVHLHVYDGSGRLFLQRRPLWKDIQPGRWDTAVGGHVAYGESVGEALRREAGEELGLRSFDAVFVVRYVYDSDVERELVNVFRTVTDGPVTPDTNELDGGRFWTVAEIEAGMGRDIFTPNFEYEYSRYLASSISPVI